MPRSPWQWVVNAGLLLIVAATALPLFMINNPVYRYLLTAGAVAVFVGRMSMPKVKGGSLRLRRLCRIELWAGIIFCAAACFVWWPGARPMDWLAFTLAGGMLQIYTSIMIPRQIRKDCGE